MFNMDVEPSMGGEDFSYLLNEETWLIFIYWTKRCRS